MTIGLEFDAGSDRVLAHIDGPDGHSHANGTYTWDEAKKAVVVKAKLQGDGKADTWQGTVTGDALELTGGDVKLKWKRGTKAHGH